MFMRHFGIAFSEKRIPLLTATTDTELAPYFSDYKVPVLRDGNLIIWDSLSILEYVSESYLDAGGWPSDPRARAVARSVSAEMHSSFMNVRNELPMNCRKTFHGVALSAEAEKEVERIRQIWQRCRSTFGAGGAWLFGGFSIADAMYAPVALRFAGYSIPSTGPEEVYVRTMLGHPAIVEWMAAGKQETEIIEMYEIET